MRRERLDATGNRNRGTEALEDGQAGQMQSVLLGPGRGRTNYVATIDIVVKSRLEGFRSLVAKRVV